MWNRQIVVKRFLYFSRQNSVGVLILICLTLGLAHFFSPHLYEKLKMLSQG